MIVACADGTVVPEVQAVLRHYAVGCVDQQGPNLGSPLIWVMIDSGLGEDKEGALRCDLAQIAGATIYS